MARRRRRKDIFSTIGKVTVLCLCILAGYYTYNNYGDQIMEKINEKTTENSKDKKDKTTKEKEETTTTTKEKKDSSDTKKEEGKKEYTYQNQEGEKVNIKADKSVEATGFAGASNHKFYLRGTTLYYKNISSDEKEVILAYNVEDLFIEHKEVTAILSKDGKIVTENNYITYKNK